MEQIAQQENKQPQKPIQCESTSSQVHADTTFYCFKCKQILCYDCLIPHLCAGPHESSSIKKMAEALNEGQSVFTSLKVTLKSINIDIPTNPIDNPVEKLLAKKQIEFTNLIESMKGQVNDVLETVTVLFDLLKKKDDQMTNEDYKKTIEIVCGELEQIAANWNLDDNEGKLKHLKKIAQYERKVEELMSIVKEKGNNNRYKKYKERGTKEIGLIIDEIGLNGLVNWHKKQSDAIKLKIKNQIAKLEKYFDDFPSESDEIKESLNQREQEVNRVAMNGLPNKVVMNTMSFQNPNPNPNLNTIQLGDKTTKLHLSHKKIREEETKASDIEMKPIQQENQISNIETPLKNETPQPQPQSIQLQQSLINSPMVLEEQNIQIPIPKELEYVYKGTCLFTLRRKDATNPVEAIIYKNKQISCVKLIEEINFDEDTYTPQFPYKSSKSLNLGDSLLISGGSVDSITTNRVFKLQYDKVNESKLIVTDIEPMNQNREGHNLLYMQKSNRVLACSGVLNTSTEMIDFNDIEPKWKDLPSLNQIRTNATLLFFNDNDVYCIGGFNNQFNTYVNGYECLSLNNLAKGWRNVVVKEEIAICTMGFIQLGSASALLLGGFAGGKRYLQEGFVFKFEDNKGEGDEKTAIIERKENMLSKGIIFYSSPQFFLLGDEVVNFDFKQNIVVYNYLTQRARIKVSESIKE